MSSQRHALRWSLPDEVVLKIVFSIPGRRELANFIKALGPYYAVDLLGHLRKVQNESILWDWWPYLVLRPAFQTNAQLSSFEQVAKHFTIVRVFNSFDLNWLTAHVDPMADQEWKFDTFDGISDDFWTKWAASQRISVVKSYVRSGVPLNLIHIFLPQLHYLSHLTLASNENLALILAFAAQSTRLNELVINIFPWTAHELITGQMANDVIEWFHRQPVRVFQFSNWNLVDLDATLKQLFYQVVFTCPTLEELSIYNTKLDDVDFSGMALSTKSLTLSKCRLDPTFEEFLKSQGIPHLFVFHN